MGKLLSIVEKLDKWETIFVLPGRLTVEFNQRNSATRYTTTGTVELTPVETFQIAAAIVDASQKFYVGAIQKITDATPGDFQP
jgi:hypothetical protein